MNKVEFRLSHGCPFPLGATPDSEGVNFAFFSAHAEKVELCLYDSDGLNEVARITVKECSDAVWHVYVKGLKEGVCYAYRVHGAFEPSVGHRFNPNKLLLDPYARELKGSYQWDDANFAYPSNDEQLDLAFSDTDNAQFVPKAVVVAPLDSPAPIAKAHEWRDTVIYEMHVRGLTQLHARLPKGIRGGYKALGHPDLIAYLLDLGVTAVELLPVHYFLDENFLSKKELSNYWGYNTLSFFAPHHDYASTQQVREEFRDMVDALHKAGLEVILDVVYNHTAEGNHLGPTLSFRGIDNASYYCLTADNARYYVNDTGCGNTLNMKHPRVRQLVLDSLRYWAGEMGVDGFRFDLATVMGREQDGFNRESRFFEIIKQDPILSSKKMIAEPWDIGPGGYQLGNFPSSWAEWNDRYRDTVRRFWRGDAGMLPEFARRIHGSNELFEHAGRRPSAGVNFIAAHDGFTVRDIVCYNKKHNDDNKEKNQDGHNSNFSHNHGIEGQTDNKEINILRARQQRNMLATLLISQGTPMLNMGDELGRSQNGNNNAYCQDNETSWVNWGELILPHWQLKSFVRHVLNIRKEYSLFRSRTFIHKPEEDGAEQKYNIHWLNASGHAMSEADWANEHELSLCWMLESIENKKEPRCVVSLFNAKNCSAVFQLPQGWSWRILIDTRADDGRPRLGALSQSGTILLIEKAMIVIEGQKAVDDKPTSSDQQDSL